jgi:hypothetical protein
MASAFLGKRRLGALLVSLAVPLAGAAARAETPPLTLHLLGTNKVSVPTTSGRVASATASREVDISGQQQWFGADLDLRLDRRFSLDLGVSQGGLDEERFDVSQGVGHLTSGTAPVRHLTLSALYHPVSAEHRVDFYLGPTAGMAYASRVFAPSETRTAYGGKLGFDVRLGRTPWLFTAVASVLKSDLQVLAGAEDDDNDSLYYRLFAVGIGCRW